MLKFNPTAQRQPFGGHHYPEYGVTFRGDSVEDVKAQLTKFRLNNSIPVGNPEQDILLFYAKHWPWLVKGDLSPKVTMEDADYAAWREWIYEEWKNPGSLITRKEACMRWEKCLTCPRNLKFSWQSTDESNELTRRAFLLRKGLEVPIGLGFCDLHKADLSVMVFLKQPEKHSNKKDGEAEPGCWFFEGQSPLSG